MNRIYIILAAMLLSGGLMVGAFYKGMDYQKKKDVERQAVDFRKSVEKALEIADRFVVISADFVKNMATTKEVTKTITETQVKYVTKYIHDHPEITPCLTAPAPVISLRRCQISRLRQAAGYPVSSDSDGDVCSS